MPGDGGSCGGMASSGPAWLTLYLVDRQERVVYRRIGEGDYAEIEARIGAVLAAP